jgi:ribosomal protein S18 acetylase RimI-like enzyme
MGEENRGEKMEIRRYSNADEEQLFIMMREEGPEWESYYAENKKEKYLRALASSLTYTAYQGNTLCGYIRCRDDDGFGVYIYDLLVRRSCRGQGIGQKLIEFVCAEFPEDTVYVMSDVDDYYKKLGYRREGSIFEVQVGKQRS